MTGLSIADVLDVEYPGAPEWWADGRFVVVAIELLPTIPPSRRN
jgi:hypothetical protein